MTVSEDAMSGARSDLFVSFVSVLESSETPHAETLAALSAFASERFSNYEIILVDNGVSIGDVQVLRGLLEQVPAVRILRLSRALNLDDAFFAGLDSAIGDIVVMFEWAHDGVEPVAAIVGEMEIGRTDVLQGVAQSFGRSSHRVSRNLFFWYNRRVLGLDMHRDGTYLIGLSRRALNNILAMKRRHRYVRHLVQHVGYPITRLPYVPKQPRVNRRGFVSSVDNGIEMVSSYSTQPLRLVSVIGLTAAFLNLLYAGYVVIVALVKSDVAAGWTTTSLQLSVMFFLLSLALSLQAEYIGRILSEVRGDAPYVIKEELESSTVIADQERRNVSE